MMASAIALGIGYLFGKILKDKEGISDMMIGFIFVQMIGLMAAGVPNVFTFLILISWNGESSFLSTTTVWLIRHWISNVTIIASCLSVMIWIGLATQKKQFFIGCIFFLVITYLCHQGFLEHGVGAIRYLDPENSVKDGPLYPSTFKGFKRGKR